MVNIKPHQSFSWVNTCVTNSVHFIWRLSLRVRHSCSHDSHGDLVNLQILVLQASGHKVVFLTSSQVNLLFQILRWHQSNKDTGVHKPFEDGGDLRLNWPQLGTGRWERDRPRGLTALLPFQPHPCWLYFGSLKYLRKTNDRKIWKTTEIPPTSCDAPEGSNHWTAGRKQSANMQG